MRDATLPTPCYVVSAAAVERNLRIISRVQTESSAKVLLALKGFAMWSLFPLIRKYLPGITASSVNEAKLGHEYFGGEVHVYAPAYAEAHLAALLPIADHVTFNSLGQWLRHRATVAAYTGQRPQCALRINPEHSEVRTALYDPCASGSRLGITAEVLDQHVRQDPHVLQGISGLHFHTLCQANSDALERTVAVVEEKFASHLKEVRWVNFGGGHHISRPDYGVDRLIDVIKRFAARWNVQVYLEPGEAIALNTGVLVASVLDIVHNDIDIAILDSSASAHMPDVLEMPYRPPLLGGDLPGRKPHTYRLGGLTCLAGDVIGDFSFDAPLKVGDRLIFGDMAHYTMVKNTTFNGVELPSIAIYDESTGQSQVIRQFGYEDYKGRLS